MRAFLTLLLLILSGIATASSPIAIPSFPTIGDCHQYVPVGKRPWLGKLVTPPGYMECTTEEGVRFSISESDYYNGSSWLEWMGKGSDVQPEYDFLTIGDAMRPVSILDTAPFLIVSYKAPIGFQEVTVIFLRDKKNGTRPFLITTGRQSRTADHLKYAYQDQKNNWISNYQFTYMHEDGYKKKELPSSFPYYAFSQLGMGAHCCFNIILIDKNKPHRVSHYWDNMEFEPWFGDVNNDGEYEMFAPDYSYSHWPHGFGGAPAPRLIWRITPSGFSLAPDLMIESPLDQATLKSQIEWMGDNVDSDSLYLPYELYGTTLDLIYSGNEQRAWEFFDDAWPTFIETENQEDFRKEFRGMICSSLFADSLNVKERDRFLEQTCGSYASEVTINYEGGTYTGEVVGGVPHGQGTWTHPNGKKYVGDFKEDKIYGQGTWTNADGDKYVGEFKDNLKQGQGTYTFANGDKYVGEFKNDKKHGQGMYTFGEGKFEGDIYIGEFKNGKKNGRGTATSLDGRTYVGEFKDDKMHGQGAFTYPDGDKYVGKYKEGKENGQGTYTSNDGVTYVGEWKGGLPNGQGTSTIPDEEKYVGQWKDGLPNGQGTSTYSDGSEYVGEWKEDKRHGQGTFTYPDGSTYIGGFKDGKPDGQSTITTPDGEKYVGDWKDGKRWNGTQYDKDEYVTATYLEGVRQAVSSTGSSTSTDMVTIELRGGTYKGQVSNGVPHGQGTWTHPDGMKYVGEWKDGKTNGQGTWTYPDGTKYVGEWRDDKFHGQGTETYPDGSKYVGEFRDGKENGQGTYTYPDGTKYVGEWKDGLLNGQGTSTYSDGSEYVGKFKDDKKHGQGTWTDIDGDKYVGEWKDDKYHGQGTWTHSDGHKYVGEWRDDELWKGIEYDKEGNAIATVADGVLIGAVETLTEIHPGKSL